MIHDLNSLVLGPSLKSKSQITNHNLDKLPDGLVRDADGITRCWWPGADPLYVRYHDEEWGTPVTDDRRLFEKICLEGFQATAHPAANGKWKIFRTG